VSITKILQAGISNKSIWVAFIFLKFEFIIFRSKSMGVKAANKILIGEIDYKLIQINFESKITGFR